MGFSTEDASFTLSRMYSATDSTQAIVSCYPLIRKQFMAEDKKSNEKLIVNQKEHEWPKQFIEGAEFKSLAGSPEDCAVNITVPGGEDPEIGDTQEVDLSEHAEPKGIKRFTTRKPTTSPRQ
ncbi:multiubiquitin domain-containing protein [Bradyrhizobium sp. 179]|uniref:multiubiquitin domain-containing protein n=1 Tax=Bradyrhizobium sp. 179 TaxID=2782648 RepID=UPI001FF83145|nr:multiubiquitin domain-containing protein [Bradyrhizobium sp. 179]